MYKVTDKHRLFFAIQGEYGSKINHFFWNNCTISWFVETKEQVEISQCNKQTSLKIFIVQKHEKLWYDFIKKGYSANGVRIKVNIAFVFSTSFY